MLSESSNWCNSSALWPNLSKETGSREDKMATVKPEMLTALWRRIVIALFQSFCLTPTTWVYLLKFRCYLVYKRIYSYLKFEAAILDFPILVSSRLVVRQWQNSYWIAGSRKRRFNRLNFVPIMFSNLDIRIWSLEVPSWNFHFRVSSSLVVRHWYMSHWNDWQHNHIYNRWNRVAICHWAEIYAFHDCRPPSWIIHFRFSSSLVIWHWYMSHWNATPR